MKRTLSLMMLVVAVCGSLGCEPIEDLGDTQIQMNQSIVELSEVSYQCGYSSDQFPVDRLRPGSDCHTSADAAYPTEAVEEIQCMNALVERATVCMHDTCDLSECGLTLAFEAQECKASAALNHERYLCDAYAEEDAEQ